MFGPLIRISSSSAIRTWTPGSGLPTDPNRNASGVLTLATLAVSVSPYPPSPAHRRRRRTPDAGSDQRRPGHRLAQAPAEQVAHVGIEALLGALERRPQLRGDLLAATPRLAHRDSHTRCLLELSSVAGARGQRMDLLEDPRHRREERRLKLHQVGHDLLRVLLPVGERGAGIEHQELDDQRERVRQRQKQVHAASSRPRSCVSSADVIAR